MATYPTYDFSDPNLDYNLPLATSREMYSDLLHQRDGCCKSKSVLEVLCQADVLFQDIVITGTVGETYNLQRWKEDIKDVYTILSSFFRLSADAEVSPTVVFPAEALEDMLRGKQYLSNLNSEYLDDLHRGCMDCKPLSFECLKRLLRALDFKNELDEYDDIAIKLLEKVILIIGDYSLETPPTVNAGADQTAEIGGTVIFTATATPGSSPIVSYQWVQTSGTPATLTNANTASVSVSNYPEGIITLQVTVTDQNSLTDSDSAQLTGIAASLIGYWWLSDEGDAPLTESEILTKTPFNFADGGDMTVAFTGLTYKIPNIAYPDSQANRVHYVNVADSADNGDLGTSEDLLGAVVATGIFKQQNGNYVLNGNRTLKFS